MSRKLTVLLIIAVSACALCLPAFAEETPQTFTAPLSPAFIRWQQKQNASQTSINAQTQQQPESGVTPDPVDWSHLSKNPPKINGGRSGANVTLPAKYDLREHGALSPVRNQNPYGTCWSFAATGAMESSYLIQKMGTDIDLSELHMAWFVYNDPNPGYKFYKSVTGIQTINGGNAAKSTAYFARMTGPVSEASLPYSTASTIADTASDPSDYHPVVLGLAETYKLGAVSNDNRVSIRPLLKQLIMEKGAVLINYYAGDGATSPSGGTTAYFDNSHGISIDHSVLIAGWDDDFPREDFSTDDSKRPANNGAWLVRNSWGDTWPYPNGDGYFWMSYEQYFDDVTVFIAKAQEEGRKHYGHDALGMTGTSWTGYNAYKNRIWAANVFKAGSDEVIKEVALFTTDNNASFDVYIYDLGTETPSSPVPSDVSTYKLRSLNNFAAFAGYHTHELSQPVSINKDHYFSVVMNLAIPEGSETYPAAVERTVGNYAYPEVNAGESYHAYYYMNDDVPTSWIDPNASGSVKNYCIKAFTVPGSNAPVVPDGTVAVIDAAAFPDDTFRAYIKEKADTNGDGYLTDKEISDTKKINVESKGITSLKGIEYFTALTELDCHNNQLAELDISRNTSLTKLHCGGNQLTALDVSNNTALIGLSCSSNQLTTLDVSHNTALSNYLYCNNNQLTELNVSNNTALLTLGCYNNQLTALDISSCTTLKDLRCYNNQLAALDVSNNTALTRLYCQSNKLTALDVSKNTALADLDCEDNQLTTLDVSKNTALADLACGYNQLTALDVSSCTALKTLRCNKNQLTTLDVSKNTALAELYCNSNQLTSLILGNNTELTSLQCEYNKLATLDIRGCPNLPTDPISFWHDDGLRIIDGSTDPQPEFNEGHALVLDGQIGVIFYVMLPEEPGTGYNASNCWMEFDIRGDKSNNPQPLDTTSRLNFTDENGVINYAFVCYINSAQMADTITATLHYGDNMTLTQESSADAYLTGMMSKFSGVVKDLMIAIKDYGHYVQPMLSNANGWKIGDLFLEMKGETDYTDQDIEKVRQAASPYAIVRDTGTSRIDNVGLALRLGSTTSILLYLNVEEGYTGSVAAYFEGSSENVAVKQSSGQYIVEIDYIPAHELHKVNRITVNAGGSFEIQVSALSYVDTMLNKEGVGTDIKEAVTALYNYWDAAMKYKASISQ